ncbi:DnaJ domain-containing protein [Besnoitia besnoiti]|uniref:enoyl-[acyl-carrier-protein] reductase n=1 Tax=Besnoitia besnoiti TaxID=94643 RepID=A0A2A9M0K5_BESBE|nr:DnaJ domain-containing protein [Besnoitia besnoiti]PFH32128.1 DnaJ domain-containing protein [Besnoitia besnoiti]
MGRVETHYEVLGVPTDAALGDIKKAFRQLVKVHHPDKKSGDPNANQGRYLQIQEAFETLSDCRARQDYDAWLHEQTGSQNSCTFGKGSRPPQGSSTVEQRFLSGFFKSDGTGTDYSCSEPRSDIRGSTPVPVGTLPSSITTTSTPTLFRAADEPETTDLFRRLDRADTTMSHSEGFEQWLRSRPASSLGVVNDDVILSKQGPATRPQENAIVKHTCIWPVTAIVREHVPGRGENRRQTNCQGGDRCDTEDNRDERPDKPRRGAAVQGADVWKSWQIKAISMKLKDELDWGEVLVRVLHAAVLPYDLVMARDGLDILGEAAQMEDERLDDWLRQEDSNINGGSALESKLSFTQDVILGCSCLAEVIEAGPGVKLLSPGDYVFPLGAGEGCWRAASIWKERNLMKVPKDLFPRTEETAVAKELFLAYHLLQEHARTLKPGDAVLVNSAGCLVGQMLVQFCRLLGLRCICIVNQYLRSLGATDVFAPHDNVTKCLRKTRQSLPLVAFELSGGSLGGLTVAAWVARGGKVVLVHAAGDIPAVTEKATIPWTELLSRDIRLESFYLTGWLTSARNRQKMISALENIGALVRAGKLVVDLADPLDVSPYTGAETAVGAMLAVYRGTSGEYVQQPLLTFASFERERLLYEEEQAKVILQEQQTRRARELLFTEKGSRSCASDKARLSEYLRAHEATSPVEARAGGGGLSMVELPPDRSLAGHTPRSDESEPICVFLHDRGAVPEELKILFRHYRQHFRETFQGAHFVFPAGPFVSSMFPVEAVLCLGAPLLEERILRFLLARADSHAREVKIFFLVGSKDTECPAWAQEEWRTAFERCRYCVTREAIIDGTHETDDRTLAHVAAVFSVLRLT